MKKYVLTIALLSSIVLPAQANEKMTFEQIDANKNNLISLKEMLSSTEKRFAKVDKNKDKIISVDEVLSMMPFVIRPMAKGKVTEFLKTMDANKDGKTHLDEIIKLTTAHFKLNDKNKDGNLDKAEYTAFNTPKKK